MAVDEILVGDKTALEELFEGAKDDLAVVVELFTEVDDAFTGVVDVLAVDEMPLGTPFGAGAPLATRRRKKTLKLNNRIEGKRFMALEGIWYVENLRYFSSFL